MHEDAVRRAELRETYDEALSEQRLLIESSDEHDRHRSNLALATRAESLKPLVDLWQQAQQRHEKAIGEYRTVSTSAGVEVTEFANPDRHLVELLARQRDGLAKLRALSPQADELRRLSVTRRQWTTEMDQLTLARDRAIKEHEEAVGQVRHLQEALDRAQQAAD